jgi:deazaflavin-dependent oxidoreductase (nitroreductase family)
MLTLLAILANSVSPTVGHREETAMDTSPHYRKPGLMTRKVLNPVVSMLTKAGISVWGSRVLEVRGRTSGELRRTPVNLLELDGVQYLVSARGNGQWVRNVRAADGKLDLLVGRHREERTAEEVPDSEKAPVLRAYLRKWKSEVGIFFDGVTADSEESDLQRIAPNHPVFRLSSPQN